jgi:organic hydroperoxide reductase OsmC/OhrA
LSRSFITVFCTVVFNLYNGDSGFFLRVRLNVSLPGLDRAVAQDIITAAHGICPYSKAVHGNIDVTTNLV